MDKSFPQLLFATIFLFLLMVNTPIAASQLYFPPPGYDAGLSAPSSDASLEPPQVHFPTEEEVIAAQQGLGPNLYIRLSNASQGSPSEVQAATVTDETATNETETDNNMYVTWIGNDTTVFLSVIPANGTGLEDQTSSSAKPISLNNTVNASNLQISTLPGLISITWDAIDADTGLQNVYGSLSRDGMNFYSFQISSGLNNASNPWQPDPHFVLYNETGDADSVCSGPQLDAGAETSTNSTTDDTEAPDEEYVCRYRWG
jgi:hypothetical protein